MASFGDVYNYQVAFGPSGDVQTIAAVQKVGRATRQAADDAKRAAKEQERAAKEAAREQVRAAKEAARTQELEARKAAREQEKAARDAARAQAAAARKAAREQEKAARDAARAQVVEAKKAAREQAEEAQRAAQAQAAAARQAEAATSDSAEQIRRAGQRIGQGIGQAVFVFDDAAYGARALRNQILPLSTAMLGFGPAGAIVGAAGTVLVGVFHEQIDAALAWAGILDENLVKARDKEEALGGLSEATDANTEATNRNAEAQKNQTVAFLESADAATTAARAAAQDIAQQFGGQNVRNALIKALEANFADAGFALTGFIKAQAEKQADAIVNGLNSGSDRVRQWAQEELEKAARQQEDVFKRFGVNLGDLLTSLIPARIPGLDKMLTDMKRVGDAAEEAAEKRKKAAEEEKEAIEESKKANREWADAILEEFKAVEEADEERIKRVLERRALARRAELDEDTLRVVEALGPRLQGGIGQALQRGVAGGMSPEQAAFAARTQAAGLIRRIDPTIGEGVADQAAAQMVHEQFAQIRRVVDANNAAANLMRLQLENTGFLLNSFERTRAQILQMMQMGEMQRRQIRQNTRRNQPFRFMHGNAVNGRF